MRGKGAAAACVAARFLASYARIGVIREGCDRSADRESEVDDVFRQAAAAPPDCRHPDDGVAVSGAEPTGVGIHDLRASGLIHAERRLPGAFLPSDAEAVGGAGHPEASGEAGIDAPGSAEAAGGARVRVARGDDRVRAAGVGATFAAVGDGSSGHRGLEWLVDWHHYLGGRSGATCGTSC